MFWVLGVLLFSKSEASSKDCLLCKCKKHEVLQPLNHFSNRNRAFLKQRVFIFDENYRGDGTIFFYTGNEAPVELYINNTGFMWENAASFGAALVFAEHRFFGGSRGEGKDSLAFFNHEQALADFARIIQLLDDLGLSRGSKAPLIAFGGSYGGMLAAWLSLKYPHLVTGAICGSAPVLAFDQFYMDGGNRYWQIVTSVARSYSAKCPLDVHKGFQELLSLSPQKTKKNMNLCMENDPFFVGRWALQAFDYFAMGDFSFPSSYVSPDPDAELPPHPMRLVCSKFETEDSSVGALREAIGIYFNASGAISCYSPEDPGSATGTSLANLQYT